MSTGRQTPLSLVVVLLTACCVSAVGVIDGSTFQPAPAARGIGALFSVLVVPLLLVGLFIGYWIANAWCIDVGARLQGAQSNVRSCLITTAYVFPIFIVSRIATLSQYIVEQNHTSTATVVGTFIGIVNIGIVMWFVALLAVIIRVVYNLRPLQAFGAALLPQAALAALLLTLVVIGGALGERAA